MHQAALFAYKTYKDWTAPPPITGPYRNLSGTLPPGWQANHLNQGAVYREKIPLREALTVAMQGDVITKLGSSHYRFHQSLEQFWEDYRGDGKLYGKEPTNAQYGEALERALVAGGFTRAQASRLAAQAAAERAAYGLDEGAPIPATIPRRIWKP